jgi:hypothetical protein
MKRDRPPVRQTEHGQRRLDGPAKTAGRPRSDHARDARRRELTLLGFEHLRREVLPLAEAQGLLTDEDLFSSETSRPR